MATPTKVFLADLAHTYSVDNESLPVPLNIGFIKAYAVAEHGDAVDISLFKNPELFLRRACEEKPDVIGFSNYGWNENLNIAVGSYAREALPDALIIAGGPNIDPDPDQRMQMFGRHDYVDFVVVDGGEEPFSEIIEWWRDANGDRTLLPQNILWRDGDGMHRTGERTLKKVIDNIQSPYLSGYLDEFLLAGMVPMLETNRGCPFKCTFCAWGSASKDLVRRLDFDTALAEIEYVGHRSQANNWIVCDANFGILKRDIEIAKAIRKVKDSVDKPQKCHIWLAKNVTERNLEIGEILGDMVVPVMAVQSLDPEVLLNIKRDNIATDTYVEYQRKFHDIGSKTYSDVIVPLPGESLNSHIQALRDLCDYGVDIIQNHNMRLLAGAETNSPDTRKTFGFRTRYRLIHGDAGVYRCPDQTTIRAFEYEESLRETTTMTESELFYLRKLHFLVDFAWNLDVYKPLLRVGHLYGVNPIDILQQLLEVGEAASSDTDGAGEKVAAFFTEFDAKSREEWFDTREDIEAYFGDERNFECLINQEFEKLNIMFSVILLKDYKPEFDTVIHGLMRSLGNISDDILDHAAALAFAAFPALDADVSEHIVTLPDNFMELNSETAVGFVPSVDKRSLRLFEGERRKQIREILNDRSGQTFSKTLNTQGIVLRDLRLTTEKEFEFDNQFRRAF